MFVPSGTPTNLRRHIALVKQAAPHIKGRHMTTLIRIALAVPFLEDLAVGAWNAAGPEDFSHNFPTLDLTPQNLRPETQTAGVG